MRPTSCGRRSLIKSGPQKEFNDAQQADAPLHHPSDPGGRPYARGVRPGTAGRCLAEVVATRHGNQRASPSQSGPSDPEDHGQAARRILLQRADRVRHPARSRGHALSGRGLALAVEYSLRDHHDLWPPGGRTRHPDRGPRRRRRERSEPGVYRAPLPPRHRLGRFPDRLRRRPAGQAVVARPRSAGTGSRTVQYRFDAMAASATRTDALIHARGLTKRFDKLLAVDAIDFDVDRGEAFGFLGPNGAGKTSTMRMIGCVSAASGGSLRVLGMDPVQDGPRIRARLGVVPQSDTLDTELLVDENLFTYARYFGIARNEARRRAEQLLDFVQLKDRARDRVEFLSGGMKRRLMIARALVNEPELLLLDEPTTGLDPQARHLVWDRLYRLKQQGGTIVLTTHYLDEAQQLG